MKKALLGLIAIAVLATGAFAADTSTQAIEKRTAEFVAAWNRHDPKAMASVWAPEGDLLNPFGRWARGHEELVKLFTDEQSAPMKASTFTTTAIHVRTLAPNVALADWDFTIAGITAPTGTSMPPQPFHAAFVWVKKGSSWSVLAGRPMIPAALPGTPAR
jgi:uncharacterized protein (TIGR02246 family)